MTAQQDSRLLLKPWHEYVITSDEFLLRHGDGIIVFQGRASTTLLPRIISLLDGSRTAEDIVGELGEHIRPAIMNALSKLSERALLLEIDSEATPADGLRATALSLYEKRSEEVPLSSLELSVANAHFTIVGDSPLSEAITCVLEQSGVGNVDRVPDKQAKTTLRSLSETAHVVASARYAHSKALEDINEWSLETGRPWTQCLPYDGQVALVGPMFCPGQTGCLTCFQIRRRSTSDFHEISWEFDHAAAAKRGPRHTPSWQSPAQNLAIAGHLSDLLLQTTVPNSSALNPLRGRAFAIDFGAIGFAVSSHRLFRVPRCPSCSDTYRSGTPMPWAEASQPSTDRTIAPQTDVP